MVYVYMADVKDLPDPKDYPKCMETISKDRKEKILRSRTSLGRKEQLGASLLLEQVLKRFGYAIENMERSKNGKPEIDGIFFNLSHSDGRIVCAVSDKEIGCDIEKIGSYRESVARKICTDLEWNYLEQFSEEEKNHAFYRLWTMKESYVKMTGEGIRFPLRQVEFVIEDGKCEIDVFRNGEKVDCLVREYAGKEYKLTVCARETEFAELEVVALS